MVLSGTYNLKRAYGLCRGAGYINLKIEALNLNNLSLGNIFFNLCKACQVKTMASIPPSAFSAGRIRETQRDRDMKLSNTTKGKEPTKVFNTTFPELSPLKYNSKLMNSIWGFYNRYSPHNVKKVNDAFNFNVDLQQPAANSTLQPGKLEKVWAAMNVSQSH